MTRSALQSETSHGNGSLSNGLVPAEGKTAISRSSAAKALATKTLILVGESEEEFNQLLNHLLDHFQPQSLRALSLVHDLAEANWRVRRYKKVEVCILNRLMDEHTSPDLPVQDRLAEVLLLPKKEISPYYTFVRMQAMYLREIIRLQKELKALAVSKPAECSFETEPMPELRNEPEPTPRNAPCPCGSGEKYKRCCGKNAPPVLQDAA